jgi:hypothetical protein
MTEDAARAVADELERRGLAAPARLLLDAHRPLAPLISSAATFVAPLVGSLAGAGGSRMLALFEEPDGIDVLIARLDGGTNPRQEAGCPTSES